MFKTLVPIVFLAASASSAFGGTPVPGPTTTDNDPSLFLGFAFTLGEGGTAAGTPGLTLKLLSTNKRDSAAAAAGVTYNFDGSFGCDLGLGYNTSDATLTFGYDICKRGLQFGLGATKKPKTVTSGATIPDDGPVEF